MRDAVRTRPGHRGAFLLFLAVLDLVYGWALYKTQAPQQTARMVDEALLLPWQVWACLWGFCGFVCLFSAFSVKDRLGFALAATLKFSWGGVSLIEWIRDLDPNGWLSAVVWLSFSATVLIISGWPEPIQLVEPALPDLHRNEEE